MSLGVPTGASGICRRRVLLRRHLHPPLDLADRVEVVGDDDAVADAEAGLQPRGLALDAIEDAAGFVKNRRALRVGVALAEQLLKHRARVAFLRQRLRRRAPGQPRAGRRRRQLERRQARLLADVPRRHLIGGDAGIGAGDAVIPRLDAVQPRGLDIGVGLGRFARLVPQPRDDRQVLAERLQRLEDRRHLEAGAGLLGRPPVHDGAVRKPDEGEPLRRRAGRGGGPHGGGGIHRIEQRQRDRGSNAFQHRTPRETHPGQVHVVTPLVSAFNHGAPAAPRPAGTRRILN